MSPIEKLSSTPNPAVLLFDFESAPAGLEESLAATLPEATRSRITAFCHPVRRRQTPVSYTHLTLPTICSV